MNNQSLFYMTGVVVVGVVILLLINLYNTFEGHPTNETYLKYNFIKGSAIEHKGKLYTLNFDQQNALIQAINRSIPTTDIPEEKTKADFTKIIIYRFQAPDVVITPITYINDDLVFSAPELMAKGYLKEVSRGELKTLLSKTFDP